MKISILTLFPKMFDGSFEESIIKRAKDKNLVEIEICDLRKWGLTERRTVDDKPYSGGPGMILKVDVIDSALKDIKGKNSKVVVLDATGERYTQGKAKEYSKLEHLILITGHYEGIDHRVHEHLADEIISVGDYVLTGGEIPAMIVSDSVIRLLPGVVGSEESIVDESHSKPGYLEYPQYTRPEDYKGWKVPEILLSGNHGEIKRWKSEN